MNGKIDWKSDILEKAVNAAINAKLKNVTDGNEHLFNLSLRKCMVPDNYKTIRKKEKCDDP